MFLLSMKFHQLHRRRQVNRQVIQHRHRLRRLQ
jgi:hypothetical protein